MSLDLTMKAKSFVTGLTEPFGAKGRKGVIEFDESLDRYVSDMVDDYKTTPSQQIDGLTWTFTPSPKQNALSLK